MSKTAVVFSCAHADPTVNNERFDWLGRFLYDLKPDYVVDLGDGAEMASLNTYDTQYPKVVSAKSYERDIECYNDSQERLRWHFRHNKKRKPIWYGAEGNHEWRIKKAVKKNPELEGARYGMSFSHLNTDYWFDEYYEYENSAPAIFNLDGVLYAHYFSGGNYGTAISGLHHAYTLLNNNFRSSTCGHSHKRSMYFKDGAGSSGAIGLVVGCYKGAKEEWAGQANNDWWKGVVVKRDISDGAYEPEFVSLAQLGRMYG